MNRDVCEHFNPVDLPCDKCKAKPVQEQDIEDAIEAAYWHFDARKKGLNEWASAPQSERDAFKAEARKLSKGYFPTRQAQDTKREMLAVADAFIRGKRAALAEPVLEPVAWRYQDARGNYRYRGYVQGFDKEYSLLKPVPLYTAPPQRKPLVDPAEYDDAGAAERYNRGLK